MPGVLLLMLLCMAGQWEESCQPLEEMFTCSGQLCSLQQEAVLGSWGMSVPPWASVGHRLVLARRTGHSESLGHSEPLGQGGAGPGGQDTVNLWDTVNFWGGLVPEDKVS